MKKYKDKGRAKIERDKLTAAQVEALDYRGTAALCDVIVGAKGNSPADFHYELIRRDLAREVADAKAKADRAVLRAALQATIDKTPEFKGKVVAETPDGKLEIA